LFDFLHRIEPTREKRKRFCLVAWDERYVLFIRVDEAGEVIGVLVTRTKEVKSLSYSSDSLQKIKSEFGIAQDIALKKCS
jgi:hypothetical protein